MQTIKIIFAATIATIALTSCSVSKCRYKSGWRIDSGNRGIAEYKPERVSIRKHKDTGIGKPQSTAEETVVNTIGFRDSAKRQVKLDRSKQKMPFKTGLAIVKYAGVKQFKKQNLPKDNVHQVSKVLFDQVSELQDLQSNAMVKQQALRSQAADEGFLEVIFELLLALLLASVLATVLGVLFFYLLLVLLEGTLALDIILVVLGLISLFACC